MAPVPTLSAVLLAAGGSTRMGTPKALLPLNEETTLLEAHVEALEAYCPRIVVVVGAHPDVAISLGERVTTVRNRRWAETGPVESLQLALQQLSSSRVLVAPIDTPPVSALDLASLSRCEQSAVLAWEGQPGHPVLLDEALAASLREGPLPRGGLAERLSGVQQVSSDRQECTWNLNTPEEWSAWRSRSQS